MTSAVGGYSSVTGGSNNKAKGEYSSISGGSFNEGKCRLSSVLGETMHDATKSLETSWKLKCKENKNRFAHYSSKKEKSQTCETLSEENSI